MTAASLATTSSFITWQRKWRGVSIPAEFHLQLTVRSYVVRLVQASKGSWELEYFAFRTLYYRGGKENRTRTRGWIGQPMVPAGGVELKYPLKVGRRSGCLALLLEVLQICCLWKDLVSVVLGMTPRARSASRGQPGAVFSVTPRFQ